MLKNAFRSWTLAPTNPFQDDGQRRDVNLGHTQERPLGAFILHSQSDLDQQAPLGRKSSAAWT
jgi:hypothetical protein